MYSNSINKFLTNNVLWISISFITMISYLSPLFLNNGIFYTPTFDNLDSTVVWYKILAESGMIFADNNAIIPNMMSGLPRSSYPSELNAIVWLYYFFTPKTAFIINEILIHLVAFFSMYIFLKNYIAKELEEYNNVLVFIGSLYFALIPYWSGAGLSLAILPLVTYSLLNIKNFIDTKWDWILLILLPFYTSFIFIYTFYISMAGLYMLWDSIKNRKINKPFLLALFLMGTVFLLSEYRVLMTMFFDSEYVSHRTEFKVFFTESLLGSFRNAHVFFLNGHTSHVPSLQMPYILPIIIIGLLLSFVKRRFNTSESITIWILISFSFLLEVSKTLLAQLYTLPLLVLLSLLVIFLSKQNRIFGLLFLLQIFLALLAGSVHYEGLQVVTQVFPIFEKFNLTRLAFIQPILWTILLIYALLIIIRKLHFSLIFISIFTILQILTSYYYSFYQKEYIPKYCSFEQYYAPKLFEKVKKSIPEPINTVRVVSYGIEPAVSLFNGFYTIDGYSVNYPLSYKRKFRKVIAPHLDAKTNATILKARELYDEWGSKVYLLETTVTLEYYLKNLIVKNLSFNSQALCDLDTSYLISSYKFENPKEKDLKLLKSFYGDKDSWDIYLYKLECKNKLNIPIK